MVLDAQIEVTDPRFYGLSYTMHMLSTSGPELDGPKVPYMSLARAS